jgi:hypothetical protein
MGWAVNNVIPFPTSRNAFVSVRPSSRLSGYFEVLAFEGGGWRAKSIHATRIGADAAAKRLAEVERMGGGGDAA